MCASRYPTSSAGRRAASPTRPGSRPNSRKASRRRRAIGIRQRPPVVVPRARRRPTSRAAPCRSGCPPRPRTRPPRARTAGRRAPARRRRAQQAHDLERHQHADDPVEAARVGHGVEVRAEQQGGRVVLARRRRDPPELVARGVLPRRHADLAHPLRGEPVRRARARARGTRARSRRSSPTRARARRTAPSRAARPTAMRSRVDREHGPSSASSR